MCGKYQVRFYLNKDKGYEYGIDYTDIYTNNFFEFMKYMLTKRVIFFTVRFN
jgi:hypothetical protein